MSRYSGAVKARRRLVRIVVERAAGRTTIRGIWEAAELLVSRTRSHDDSSCGKERAYIGGERYRRYRTEVPIAREKQLALEF